MQRGDGADGNLQLVVVTFSPGVRPRPLLLTAQVFSALDILDYILQLLFGKHVEGLSGLHRCQLQRGDTH